MRRVNTILLLKFTLEDEQGENIQNYLNDLTPTEATAR